MFLPTVLLQLALLGSPADSVPLYTDLGTLHMAISSRVPLAQRYFDQGMRLYYAFNHAEAIRAFREAQRRDPACAICVWGEALALGPNINAPIDSATELVAAEAVVRARPFLATASPRERALIEALRTRYSATPSGDRSPRDSAYARAMTTLSRRFPNDAEVRVLHAEALMNLRPWNYWTAAMTLQPGMQAALQGLERAVARTPNHPGACHFYIHFVEAAYPERAVACAERLAATMPGAGHLVHMPGHIYIRIGRYLDAIAANEHAVHADERYIREQRPAAGMYTIGYYPHNFDFLAFAAAMAGLEAQSLAAADRLAELATPMMGEAGMTFTQHHAMRRLQLRIRFGRWLEILGTAAPAVEHVHARAMWHYARGRALIETGRAAEAQADLRAVKEAANDPRLAGVRLEFNPAPAVLAVAVEVLAGHLSASQGKWDEAVTHLRRGAALEGALNYGEPPEWSIPVRQELGTLLLRAGRTADAVRVFREDLKQFPRNAWSEAGLAKATRTP